MVERSNSARSNWLVEAIRFPLRPPVRVILRVLYRRMLKLAARGFANQFEPGERMLGFDAEPGDAGDIWFASSCAVYVDPKASPQNIRTGNLASMRIPYRRIASIEDVCEGDTIVRTLELAAEDGGGQIVGTFSRRMGRPLTEVIRKQLERS